MEYEMDILGSLFPKKCLAFAQCALNLKLSLIPLLQLVSQAQYIPTHPSVAAAHFQAAQNNHQMLQLSSAGAAQHHQQQAAAGPYANPLQPHHQVFPAYPPNLG